MGNSQNEDDKSTVILNIDELKKESLADKTGVSQILEFSAAQEALAANNQSAQTKPKCVLFDFKSTFFKDNTQHFSDIAECKVVTDVKELNKHIIGDKKATFLFYFNDAGKQINLLLAQINQKFPNVKTILIAKNLSTNKANQHQKTPSGAKQYLSWPSDEDAITKAIKG